MKIFNFGAIFFSCFVASSFAQVDIAAEVTKFLSTVGQRFECGFSAAGIPVLEPLRIASTTFNVGNIGDLNSVSITLTNGYMSGLSRYTTSDTKVNLFGGSLAFTITFPQINLNGTHKTSGKSRRNDNNHHRHQESSSTFSGTGAFTVAVKNVRVESKATFKWFPTIQVLTNSRKISIGSAVANFQGITPNGAAINQVLSNGAQSWVNQNQAYVNTQIQGILDQYITGIIVKQPNIISLITALATFDPLVGC